MGDVHDNNNHNEINGGYEDTYLQSLHPETMHSTLFSAIMMAYWDNVMGPVISKVWVGNKKVDMNEEILNYVSNHTLSGELCIQTEKHTIDPKLYVLADLGYIFCAFIFNGKSKMGLTVSSLSFIMAYSEMDRYLLLQDLIGRQVKLLVLKYRVLQQKDLSTAITIFASHLKTFIKMIDTLEESNIKQSICVKETIFGENNESTDTKLLDKKFLMRSLTSHLQTCGCAVVCGQSQERINKFVKTLSLFLSSNERYCSRYASADDKIDWIQDLFIQGLIKDDCNILCVLSISRKGILLGTYPVTLIDIDRKTVHQTPHLCKHGINRKVVLNIVLHRILEGSSDSADNKMLCCFTENLFTDDFGDISVMVQKFVTEMYDMPNKCSIKKNHVANFISMLNQKAIALLAYVETSSHSGKIPLDATQIQQMKNDLLYSSEDDFRIILACAEKLQPGFAIFLDEEQGKVIRNLEAF